MCRGGKLDILAKDPAGSKWAIENHYGEADHDHLTRAPAHAVGLERRAVIVVAESHRDEFVAVADEWNRYFESYSGSGIRGVPGRHRSGADRRRRPRSLFPVGGRPERVEIGNRRSPFRCGSCSLCGSKGVLVRPSERDASKGDLAGSVSFSGQVNDVTILRKKAFSFPFLMTMESCRVELQIDSLESAENIRLPDALLEERKAIEKALGTPLEGVNNRRHRANRIIRKPTGACEYRTAPDDRQAGYVALADAMYKFHDTLMPHVEYII